MQSLERHLVEQYKLPSDYFWHDVRSYAVLSLLPARPITVVDVGAGTGRLGAQLATARPDTCYRFIEPIATLEDRLTREFGEAANAVAGSTADADVVTLLDVIEHEADDASFLASLVRRSAPGTRFIVTVPASMLLWSAWDVELGHHRRYTRRALATALRRAGLEVNEVSYLFPELWPVALARRIRHPAHAADPEHDSPGFQTLPRSVNAVLRAIGKLTFRARHLVPFGTSLLAVGTTVRPFEANVV
jgi:SAM-dependent methyltransferase